MIQEKVVEKIKDVVTKDIWGAILDFLNLGIHFGEGENKISISIGLVLVMVVSLALASLLLK